MLDFADTIANEQAFGRPGASRGESAFPQLLVRDSQGLRCAGPVARGLSLRPAFRALLGCGLTHLPRAERFRMGISPFGDALVVGEHVKT
jgi:hypothetical protein